MSKLILEITIKIWVNKHNGKCQGFLRIKINSYITPIRRKKNCVF